MPDNPKTFADLVAAAPDAPTGGTVSLVGTLARSPDKGKFVLNTGDGRMLTLAIDAVKNHAVVGTSVGHSVVRVDVDPAALPADAAGGATNALNKSVGDAVTGAALDRPITIPDIDHHFTVPSWDYTVAWFDHHSVPYIDLY